MEAFLLVLGEEVQDVDEGREGTVISYVSKHKLTDGIQRRSTCSLKDLLCLILA